MAKQSKPSPKPPRPNTKPHDVDTGKFVPFEWAQKHPDKVEWVKEKKSK